MSKVIQLVPRPPVDYTEAPEPQAETYEQKQQRLAAERRRDNKNVLRSYRIKHQP